ncbi:acetoin utilization protein AcuC [Seohaeicola saemankumensis]|uniref:acetoin utilization protein AcuC n=1 Tax=Seohaeicola saemankumensis TaxID=481181 RepID=UPI001E2AA167|nr:acetoin utilization protein AcuC [Seohaeicola saemankumensis]MCD1625315.1 acetoin utilization protein AcuC [Seohaeicola saemankumensis]
MTDRSQARFIGSEIYRGSSYGDWHPLRVPRVSTVMDLSRALGWLDSSAYIASPRAKPAALSIWHDPTYIAALEQAETDGYVSEDVRARHNIGTHANPVFAEVFRRPATSAGGALLAGELLAQPGVIYAPAGGTHHGMPDHANGFCYFNDPVLSILSLRRQGVQRIAYVDIDAHHCDGVDHAFRDDPDVLLVSVHEENRWPRTGALQDKGAGQVFNLPVPKMLNDTEMMMIQDQFILPVVAGFKPDAIILQCGADALAEDPQSRLTLSNNALWSVVTALRPLSHRYLVLGGGGYNPWSVGRAWTGVWAVLTGHEIPDRLPADAEAVLRALAWHGNRRGRTPPDHWFTTLQDKPNNGPIRAQMRTSVDDLQARLFRQV